MRRILTTCTCLIALGLSFASDVIADNGSISNAAVSPVGLQVRWFTQVSTGVRGKIVDVHFNVNENKSTTFFEIVFATGREIISQHDLDAYGDVRGIEGAQEFAELRKEIIAKELDAAGIENTEVTIQKYTLPESTLFVLTSDGFVVAIDADSGKNRWSTEIGTPSRPTIGIGSNNNFVAAVDGTTVYCLDSTDGKVLFTGKTATSVSSGPAVSDDFVYVPLTSGRVEVFPIRNVGIGSERFIGHGRALARPIVTESSVSWTTTAGHLNVAHHAIQPSDREKQRIKDEKTKKLMAETYDEKKKEQLRQAKRLEDRIRIREAVGGITYRLRTRDQFVSAAAYKAGYLYVASINGFIYAVDEMKGQIVWEFSTGDEIEHSPYCIGNDLYVVTTSNALFKLNAKTGDRIWDKELSGISKFIGASKDRVFAQDNRGNIVLLDQESGQRVGQVSVSGVNLAYANTTSDRLFVGSTKGMIQCISEASSRIPHFHSADFVEEVIAKPTEETGEEGAVMEAGGDDDPFSEFDTDDSDDNPFGGDEADDEMSEEDENPFGGGDEDDDENPFGGGGDTNDEDDDNPFGGG